MRTGFARCFGAAVAAVVVLVGLSMSGDMGARAEESAAPTNAADAKQLVDKLTRDYDDIKKRTSELNSRATEASNKIDEKTRELTEQQARVETLREQLTQVAIAQYQRGMDASGQLVVQEDPETFLTRLSTVEKVEGDNMKILQDLQNEEAALSETKRQLEQNAAQVKVDAEELVQLDSQAKDKLQQARSVASRLSASEQAAVNQRGDSGVARDAHRPNINASAGNRYAPGNCTWYSYERRQQLGRPVGSFWGNANAWASNASAAGFRVDGTPEVGAVMVSFAGWAGHVAVVESVNGDGSFSISEMNYAGLYVVSNRTVSAGEAASLRFIH